MADQTHDQQSIERGRSVAVELIFSAATILMLVVPALVTFASLFSSEEPDAGSRRKPIPRLSLEDGRLAAFPDEFRAWFGHSFGLRTTLLRMHAATWYLAFETSPSERFVLGKQDWLFTTTGRSLDALRGAHPLSPAELEDWRITLEARRDWLAARGTQFVFVVAPSKCAVYPELLPNSYVEADVTRRAQFIEYMQAHSDVRVVDLLPAMLEAKGEDRADDHAYYPLGTHWTPRGAYHGYSAIVRELATDWSGMTPWPPSDFGSAACRTPDDLAATVFLDHYLQQVEKEMPARRKRPNPRPPRLPRGSAVDSIWTHTDTGLPRALLLTDSYGEAVTPFLAQHFSKLHLIVKDSFPTWVIERAQPDVVIQLYVDRFTERIRPTVQTVFDTDRIRARFAESTDVRLPASPPGTFPELTGYRVTDITGGDSLPAVLHLTSGSDGFLVDEFPAVDRGSMTVLRLVLDAPQATLLSVFYGEEGVEGYRHQRSEVLPVHAGRNEVFVVLSSPTLSGQLLVRPGLANGDYAIHAVEVRAIAR